MIKCEEISRWANDKEQDSVGSERLFESSPQCA